METELTNIASKWCCLENEHKGVSLHRCTGLSCLRLNFLRPFPSHGLSDMLCSFHEVPSLPSPVLHGQGPWSPRSLSTPLQFLLTSSSHCCTTYLALIIHHCALWLIFLQVHCASPDPHSKSL